MKDMFRRLRVRVTAMIGKAIVTMVDESTKVQRLQIQLIKGIDGSDTRDGVDHLQPYGMSFSPPAGSEVVTLHLGAVSECRVAILAHHPEQRPTDAEPSCGGLYTSGQWRVYVDPDGVVHVGAKEGADFVALAQKVDTELARIWDLLTGSGATPWLPVSMDGGAALQTAATTVAETVQSVASTKAKAT